MRALGMMSGTSLDGIDAALIETDGTGITAFGRSAFRPYSGNESGVLHAALGQWPGGAAVAEAAAITLAGHADLAAGFPEAGVIGFHGQTFAHDPANRRTHQAGSGAALARRLDRPVVWDFRSEDVRQGGEGAPLAPFFHHACARWAMAHGDLPAAPVGFLNLGGVGNISWVDPRLALPEDPLACVAFDTGPANAPINDLLRRRRGAVRDENGALALAGRADPGVVEAFLQHPHFARRPPKSLDRDGFPALVRAVAGLDDADAAATLVAALAQSVAAGFLWLPEPPSVLLVCGGGRHNAAIMAALRAVLPSEVLPVEAVALDGDMLEAQCFGWLALRVLRGLPTSGPRTTGAPGPVCGGRISYPHFLPQPA